MFFTGSVRRTEPVKVQRHLYDRGGSSEAISVAVERPKIRVRGRIVTIAPTEGARRILLDAELLDAELHHRAIRTEGSSVLTGVVLPRSANNRLRNPRKVKPRC